MSDKFPDHPFAELRKIGILGGTFDPPHFGHLAIARAAIEGLGLDEVIFLPANRNPAKSRTRPASTKDRFEMVKLLIEKEPQMAVSDIEVTRGGLSYTVETLTELQMAQPAQYWFILGMDSLRDFSTWKSPHRIVKLARLAVFPRENIREMGILASLSDEVKAAVDKIPMTVHPASSTEVRERLLAKKDNSSLAPQSVLSYIRSHHLYEI